MAPDGGSPRAYVTTAWATAGCESEQPANDADPAAPTATTTTSPSRPMLVGRWGSAARSLTLRVHDGGHRPRPRSTIMGDDAAVRARILEHWRASENGDSVTEHAIYAEDAV